MAKTPATTKRTRYAPDKHTRTHVLLLIAAYMCFIYASDGLPFPRNRLAREPDARTRGRRSQRLESRASKFCGGGSATVASFSRRRYTHTYKRNCRRPAPFDTVPPPPANSPPPLVYALVYAPHHTCHTCINASTSQPTKTSGCCCGGGSAG